VDEVQAAELETALNRLEPLVVRRAIDALRNHPLRQRYRILSFATGAAVGAELGVKLAQAPNGNYVFRLTFSDPGSALELSARQPHPTFNEVTLSADSLRWFAEALRDVLRRQGFHD
jgi:hypothetical protein